MYTVGRTRSKSTSGSSSSRISAGAVLLLIDKLKREHHRSSTRANYYGIWRTFNEFFIRLDTKPNSWEDRIVLFVGYLIQSNHKANTINSYISAIKSVLRDDGVEIKEDRYLQSSLTKACRYINDRVKTRLPIQRGMLSLLMDQVKQSYLEQGQPYLACLYSAVFYASYYGLLRIGEAVSGTHPICVNDVHIANNKQKILFVLRTSKTHWTDRRPQTVKITSSNKGITSRDRTHHPQHCPYDALRKYILLRKPFKSEQEPFFVYNDRSPVTAMNARLVLKRTITDIGLDHKFYSWGGFPAGRATDLVSGRISVETVKEIGRWRSNAVFAYLR